MWTIAVTQEMLRKELWDSCCHICSHITSGSLSIMQLHWRNLVVVLCFMLTEIFIVWSHHSIPTRKTDIRTLIFLSALAACLTADAVQCQRIFTLVSTSLLSKWTTGPGLQSACALWFLGEKTPWHGPDSTLRQLENIWATVTLSASFIYCILFVTPLRVFQVCGRPSSSRHSSCWWEQLSGASPFQTSASNDGKSLPLTLGMV